MKKVTNYINEKFEEDTDPIHDMEIGIYAKRDFKTYEERYEYVIRVLPIVLHVDKIPKDILKKDYNGNIGGINEEYYRTVADYVEDYTTRNEDAGWNSRDFAQILADKHPETYTYAIKESFTEDSDPIHDMNIGIEKAIHNFVKNKLPEWLSEYKDTPDYRGGEHPKYFYNHAALEICAYNNKLEFVKYLIKQNIGRIINSMENDKMLLGLVCSEQDNFEVIKVLLGAGMEMSTSTIDKYYLNIIKQNKKLDVLEYIKDYQRKKREEKRQLKLSKKNKTNEAFTDDSDPIKDMSIGVDRIAKHTMHLIEEELSPFDISVGYDEETSEITIFSHDSGIVPMDQKLRSLGYEELGYQYVCTINLKESNIEKYFWVSASKNVYKFTNSKTTVEPLKSLDPKEICSQSTEFYKTVIIPKIEKLALDKIEEVKTTNESFTEDSDPIRDMGIGITTFDEYSKFIKKDIVYQDDERYISITSLKRNHVVFDLCFGKDAVFEFWLHCIYSVHKKKYICILYKNTTPSRNKQAKWVSISPKVYTDDISNKTLIGILDSKLKGKIYEAFIEDSDPIRDMGIGIPKIENLQNGMKLIVRRLPHHNWKAKVGDTILVKRILGQGRESVHFLGDHYRKNQLVEEGIDITYSKYFYDEAFRVTNESFIEDSDPIKDMKIGLTIEYVLKQLGYTDIEINDNREYAPQPMIEINFWKDKIEFSFEVRELRNGKNPYVYDLMFRSVGTSGWDSVNSELNLFTKNMSNSNLIRLLKRELDKYNKVK